MIFKRSTATYADEGRGFAADLRDRTMAAPTRIATGSLQDHSIHAALIGPCVPIHTQAEPINTPKTRANIVAAIISLPLAASATIQPTNMDATISCTDIPFRSHT
jgi:hypothetical protein